MKKNKVTLDKAKLWINDPDSCPKEWVKHLSKLKLWVKGLYLADTDGDSNTAYENSITIYQMNHHCKKISNFRVTVPKTEFKKRRVINSLDLVHPELRELSDNDSKDDVLWLNYEQYVSFRRQNLKHFVDMVMPRFFEYFPDTKLVNDF